MFVRKINSFLSNVTTRLYKEEINMSDTISNNLYNALQRLNRQMHRSRHRIMPPIEGLNRGQSILKAWKGQFLLKM